MSNINDFPLKAVSEKEDSILIQDNLNVTKRVKRKDLISLENANWGHGGTAIAGFSPVLPYEVLADTVYNVTTDKGGFLMEYPNLDPNFKFDTTTQRFYTDSAVSGKGKYVARIVIGFQLSTPKAGAYLGVDCNIFTDSTTGTPTDAHFTSTTRLAIVPDASQKDLEVDIIFFSDSDTAANGVGFEVTPSEAGTISKHSIYVTRLN